MPKGFNAENQQLNDWMNRIERDVHSSNASIQTIRTTLTSVEGEVGSITTQVATGNIDGGSPESVYLASQIMDGGTP